MYYIVGLGNPGEEYKMTRHNTGRMVVENFAKKNDFPEWVFDKKSNALKTEGKIGKEKVILLLPETFMNNSGNSLQPFINKIVKKKKVYPVGKRSLSYGAETLVVVHDDLDLPLARFKISFAKHSAGHKGVESVIKKIKTNAFIRVRVGISPKKKPDGKNLLKLLLGKFSPKELPIFKKIVKKIIPALETIVSEGLEKAMSEFN